MKTSLEYLSSLSANDGLSGAMRALISEASTVFAHCSSSYIEANMKVESTASELLRADNLKSDLENNKNQFNDTVETLERAVAKLARLEEMKEELEKQIRTTNANIMACRKEQNTTRKRKRDVYVEGKALKAQMDVMKEKVPRLQHEHDLAKENQEEIKAEWSELGEKFKKIVVNMQQQKYMTSHERRLSLDLPLGMSFSLNDHVSREPNSSVQGPCVDDLCTLRLGLDYIDLPCHASSERDYGSDSTLLSLASNDTANDGETMEALKIALDFITNNNDASVLSANDGLSGAMRALISEASTVFAHCSSSYIEANMKVESTASELLRADNLKSDLENNNKKSCGKSWHVWRK
ncbi:hypothetical protein Ahy_A05g023858 [Arachis hypogaea]|uniref:Uncharacterized protein n=1 Tax=Arachis hypogaea TaxID=3818 RepID=A0A445D4R2_ARAHY|nr:hypothetical protein Ahy_A05g023858 [Arachis hypogaea]